MKFSYFLFIPVLTVSFLPAGLAQTFSYDGNRWYEIEVSIFTNEPDSVATRSNELLIPDNSELVFPSPIRPLVPASKLYTVEFREPDMDFLYIPATEPVSEQQIMIGPEYSSRDSSFQLTDFERDPFIALGNESATFLEFNQDILASDDHRLLFHAVWRQPVLNRVQSTAIYIEGGDSFGGRHELEGSLRFSYNINRVDVESKLWLVEYSLEENTDSVIWPLPAIPESVERGNVALPLQLPVNYLSFMDQERSMISNELHYIDHPDIGLLVQIRPYQLPEVAEYSF